MSNPTVTAPTPVRPAGDRAAGQAFGFAGLLGSSASFNQAIAKARALAAGGVEPVLVVGEPGTGKELVARACHVDGRRAPQPFVALDCRTLDARLLESELFGSEAGALPDFIGGRKGLLETAAEGTLFLRRIDELPGSIQPRLASALRLGVARRLGGRDEFEVRCRVIASASNRLAEGLEKGRFRSDLYECFADAVVELPPLREREDDVLVLADHFKARTSVAEGVPARPFSEAARAALQSRNWRGNVRELKHVVQETVLATQGDQIEISDLPFGPARPNQTGAPTGSMTITIPPTGRKLADVEAEVIAATLRFTGGNKSESARMLGISRPTLRRKIQQYDIQGD